MIKNNSLRSAFLYYLIAISVFGNSALLSAQPIYKVSESKDVTMKLSGTSTFHDWTMNANAFTADAQFDFKAGNNNQLIALKSLSFSLPVINLKSGEKALDNNAYKALKTETFRDINYKLIAATIEPAKDNKFLIKTTGSLTIAGVIKEVNMEVYCVINKDGSIACTGSDKLKMTDYNVKPPTFMLGAMKTGDDITLDFTMIYKR